MIKAMDNIDGDNSDTSKSNRSKSCHGSDDDDGSCRSEGSASPRNNNYDHNKSGKSSVILANMFDSKGGLRESTPKSYHKGTNQRATPKGNNNVLS